MAGAALAPSVFDLESCDTEGQEALYRLISIGAGAVGGALIGTAIGVGIRGERWEEVPLEKVRMSISPLRNGGLSFSVSLAF